MLIDWFTVIAQVINFLILVWLMRRFLYQPILQAIAAREEKIATQLRDAASLKQAAAAEQEQFQRKNAEIDQAREGILQTARSEAEQEKQRLNAQNQQALTAQQAKWQAAWQHEREQLQQELSARSLAQVFVVARQVLADLAASSLEQRMCAIFVQRLTTLDADAHQRLQQAYSSASTPVLVLSAFPLPASQRAELQNALAALCGAGPETETKTGREIEFKLDTALCNGMELHINGWKLAWHVNDYLAALEKSVAPFLPRASA